MKIVHVTILIIILGWNIYITVNINEVKE